MNNEMNIFEVATREKYRFPYKGMITVEDLWDLSIVELDSIFKTLNRQMKNTKEESLLSVPSSENEILDTQIAIVKYVVSVKQQEAYNKMREKEIKQQKENILAIMARKENEEMENKSIKELQQMLDRLKNL